MIHPTRAAVRAAALALLAVLAACATVPPIDRYLLQTQPTPVRLEGAHGALSKDASAKVLADLKARSPDTGIFDRHVAIEQTLAGTPLSVGNRATLLSDGPATYAATLGAIRAARSSIHLEMYIFEGSQVGQEFADALVARQRAGVKVRVIYDSVGSIDTPKEFFDGLRQAGIEVAEFNPVSAAAVIAKGVELDHRDHRKLVVVDGRIAFLEVRGGQLYRGFVDPRQPLTRRDDRGEILNSFLRAKHLSDPDGTRYFAGEMLCGVARIR